MATSHSDARTHTLVLVRLNAAAREHEREQDGPGDGHGGRCAARPVGAVVRPAGLGRGPDRRAPVQAAAGPAARRVVLPDARGRRRFGRGRRRVRVPGVRDGCVDGTAAPGHREMVHVLDDIRHGTYGAAARPHCADAGAVLPRVEDLVARLVFRARPEQRFGRHQPVRQPPSGRQTAARVPLTFAPRRTYSELVLVLYRSLIDLTRTLLHLTRCLSRVTRHDTPAFFFVSIVFIPQTYILFLSTIFENITPNDAAPR